MNKLETIVPPLAECEKIPAGAFADSALVWTHDIGKSEFYVAVREDVELCRRDMINAPAVFPAPTLPEILPELPLVLTEVSTTQTVDRKYCRTLIQTIAPLGSLKFLKYRLYYLHSTYMEMLNANFSC